MEEELVFQVLFVIVWIVGLDLLVLNLFVQEIAALLMVLVFLPVFVVVNLDGNLLIVKFLIVLKLIIVIFLVEEELV